MVNKLCFITTRHTTIEAFVLATAEQLCDNGYEVHIVCDYNEAFAKKVANKYKFHPIYMKRGISFKSLLSVFDLIKILKNEEFDIVQYATPNASFIASIASAIVGTKVRIYSQWGIRYVGFTGGKRLLFKLLEKITCQLSTHIRSVSQLNMQFAVNEGLYNQDKVKVLGQGGTIGVDLELYDVTHLSDYNQEIRARHGIKKSTFLYGFVGRVNSEKGVNELIQSYVRVSETRDAALLIAGSLDENDINEDLFELANNHPNVIFTGLVNKSELPKYYAAFDCLVHPTYREGFGMVIQESAAMCCPVITTNIPGASEVMVKGESCLIVEPKDVSDLSDKMIIIYENDALREHLSMNARNRVELYFTRGKMIKNQLDDYVTMSGLVSK